MAQFQNKPQPLDAVEFDRTNPLADGLIWAQVGWNGYGPSADNNPTLADGGVPVTNGVSRGSGNGLAARYWSMAGGANVRPFVFKSQHVHQELGRDDQWTVFVIRRTSGTSASSAGLVTVPYQDGAWGAPFAQLCVRRNGASDGWQIINGYGGSWQALNFTASDPPFTDAQWHSLAFTRNGGAFASFKNGEAGSTTSGNAGVQTTSAATDREVIVQATGSGFEYTAGDTALVYIYNRALTAAEIRALNDDPYQVLRVPGAEVLYAPVAAGAYTLTAAVGAFTLTGVAAGLTRDLTFTAEAGAFTLTGITANLNLALQMTAEPGAFTVSGIDAGLTRALQMTAETGALTLTGIDATLSRSLILTAEVGTYTLTGPDGGLLRDVVMTADVGAYTLTGIDAGLITSGTYLLQAETGTFGITGSAAGLARESDDYSRMQLFMKMWRDTRQ